LDGALRLDGSDGSIHIFRNDITAVKHAASHVFTMTGIAFNHLVSWFEAGVGDFANSQLLVVSFLGRDDRCVGYQREMDTWVRYQISLELGQVDVEGTVETQRGRDGRDDLTDETVQIGVSWAFDVQITTANVVDGFIIDHESTVRVFQSCVRGQNRIVRFYDGRRNLRSWVDGKFKFRFLAIVNRQSLHQQ